MSEEVEHLILGMNASKTINEAGFLQAFCQERECLKILLRIVGSSNHEHEVHWFAIERFILNGC